MNIIEAFANYIQNDLGLATLGQDMFIGAVSQDAPEKCWWLVSSGGSPDNRNQTGEVVKLYVIDVFYRNGVAKDVYDNMHNFEELINSGNCEQLSEFDTIEMQATLFPADQDIDNQERTVGLTQVTIKTYYKE